MRVHAARVGEVVFEAESAEAGGHEQHGASVGDELLGLVFAAKVVGELGGDGGFSSGVVGLVFHDSRVVFGFGMLGWRKG